MNQLLDPKTNPVTAIDILLEPDATMMKNAEAANERLLKSFPKGFALGKTHQPHISCLQRYVKTADLDKVYEAVGKVLAGGEADRLEAEGVQVLLHPLEGHRPCRDRDRADRRPHPVSTETDRRRRPVHCEDGDGSGVRHHERGPRHQSTDHRLRGGLRAERNRQEVQPARDYRHRLPGLPEENAGREVRSVHVFTSRGCRFTTSATSGRLGRSSRVGS